MEVHTLVVRKLSQWKSILHCAKDSYESPSAHSGIGLMEEFLREKLAYVAVLRAPRHGGTSRGRASVVGKLYEVLLVPIRAMAARAVLQLHFLQGLIYSASECV